MKKKQSKVYLPLTGGLGNQLFQLAAALSFQNKRVILLTRLGRPRVNLENDPAIASFRLPASTSLFREKIAFNFLTKVYGYVLRSGINQKNWEKFAFVEKITQMLASLIFSIRLRSRVIISRSSGVGYSTISPNSNMIIGYYQTYKYAQMPYVNSQLRKLHSSRASKIAKKYKKLSLDEAPIVVHMRFGDYLLEKNFGIPSEQYYRNALFNLIRDYPNSQIWLFSDDPIKAQERFPKELHHKLRVIEEIDTDPAVILDCMRFGVAYVLANSTFSWWGAYLSHSINPPVIFPTPWFHGMDDPKDLFPDSWIPNASM